MSLTAAQTAAVVAANDGIGVSMAGLIRRVVVVTECDLCHLTHPDDHTCEAKFAALLDQADDQIATSDRSLAKIGRQLAKPSRARTERSV
ncbi:hypothetical protein [Actinacidiphila oryziradicis]|uniref:hypothetical protein n=1 Tax=Actinacidiphila oryziradicis TaxID=2571141 RepID=UPI0023F0FC9C|nr:hypothetical protein [Actinacidiphila oryziradicis]MCW2870257.1 hypothetical protein [Actinacidiphila oryziradicis]